MGKKRESLDDLLSRIEGSGGSSAAESTWHTDYPQVDRYGPGTGSAEPGKPSLGREIAASAGEFVKGATGAIKGTYETVKRNVTHPIERLSEIGRGMAHPSTIDLGQEAATAAPLVGGYLGGPVGGALGAYVAGRARGASPEEAAGGAATILAPGAVGALGKAAMRPTYAALGEVGARPGVLRPATGGFFSSPEVAAERGPIIKSPRAAAEAAAEEFRAPYDRASGKRIANARNVVLANDPALDIAPTLLAHEAAIATARGEMNPAWVKPIELSKERLQAHARSHAFKEEPTVILPTNEPLAPQARPVDPVAGPAPEPWQSPPNRGAEPAEAQGVTARFMIDPDTKALVPYRPPPSVLDVRSEAPYRGQQPLAPEYNPTELSWRKLLEHRHALGEDAGFGRPNPKSKQAGRQEAYNIINRTRDTLAEAGDPVAKGIAASDAQYAAEKAAIDAADELRYGAPAGTSPAAFAKKNLGALTARGVVPLSTLLSTAAQVGGGMNDIGRARLLFDVAEKKRQAGRDVFIDQVFPEEGVARVIIDGKAQDIPLSQLPPGARESQTVRGGSR